MVQQQQHLYPLVRDLSNVEQRQQSSSPANCCCSPTDMLGDFSLRDLAIPLASPRSFPSSSTSKNKKCQQQSGNKPHHRRGSSLSSLFSSFTTKSSSSPHHSHNTHTSSTTTASTTEDASSDDNSLFLQSCSLLELEDTAAITPATKEHQEMQESCYCFEEQYVLIHQVCRFFLRLNCLCISVHTYLLTPSSFLVYSYYINMYIDARLYIPCWLDHLEVHGSQHRRHVQCEDGRSAPGSGGIPISK